MVSQHGRSCPAGRRTNTRPGGANLANRKMSKLKKFKPVLITAAIAIVAVYVWNTYLEPRLTKGKFQA